MPTDHVGCEIKIVYATRELAVKAMAQLIRKNKLDFVRVYQCSVCQQFHLTRQKKRGKIE